MTSISRQIGEWTRHATGWLRQAEGWQIALVVLAAIFIVPALPVVLTLAVVAALFLFARAWLKEFTYLMRLGDDAFPGHNDKLIWAILLIVMPPVGAWLFQTYREAHWPEVKPTRADAFDY
jgi:hypothetical protein